MVTVRDGRRDAPPEPDGRCGISEVAGCNAIRLQFRAKKSRPLKMDCLLACAFARRPERFAHEYAERGGSG
jgi:hypothetical protein